VKKGQTSPYKGVPRKPPDERMGFVLKVPVTDKLRWAIINWSGVEQASMSMLVRMAVDEALVKRGLPTRMEQSDVEAKTYGGAVVSKTSRGDD